MSDYEVEIRKKVKSFVRDLEQSFQGEYDYIEGIDENTSLGLEHIDEEIFNKNPLEVSISFHSVDHMSMEEFEAFDSRVKYFAEREGISVESTSGNGDYVEYTFYLHGSFLNVSE